MDQHEMFTEVVVNVAKMCAVSAMTAPKSGGQLFLKGSKPFIETRIVQDKETLHRLAEWLRARGTKLASMNNVDTRCQTRVAAAARALGIIHSDLAVALSMSVSHKSIFFDKKIPEIDFEAVPTS